jgi:iron complex outermembrane receptor protein
VGGDSLREGGFAVGGPLSAAQPDAFMVRLALHRSASDNFRHNATLTRDTDARDEFNARLRFTVNPSSVWHWDGALLYSDLDNGFDEFALDNNGRLTYSDQPGQDAQRSQAASLRGSYTGLAGARFTTISSGSWVNSTYSYDDDWTPASYAGFSDLRRDRRVLNQELRLDSAATRGALGWFDRWTLGAYYSETKENGAYTDTDPFDVRGLRTRYHAENAALYGQVGHDFSPATRLVLGLRGEHIDLNGRGTKTRFRKTRNAFDPAVTFAPVFDDSLWGGKITLEHDLSDRQLVFVSLTRGYKAGGINIDARINPPADPLTYATETLWNWEAGLRGAWLGGRLTGDFTAFCLQRDNTQVRDSAGFGGNYRFFTSNGNDAHVAGLEAAANFAVTKAFSLHGSVAHLDSELERFTLTNGNTGGGRVLANTPRYGYTAGARFHAKAGFFANADLIGRAEQFDSNNQNESRRPFRVVNASIGYTRGKWTFTVWGRNVFDERYEKRVFFFGNEDPDYVETRYEDRADPRQVGATAAYRF